MEPPAELNAPLGVCVLPAPAPNRPRTLAHGRYVHEILQHAGLCYTAVPHESLADALPRLRVLVTIGEGDLSEAGREALRTWVQDGGAWVAVAGALGLEDVLGVAIEQTAYQGFGTGLCVLGEGYLAPTAPDDVLLGGVRIPLHFFNGLPVTATSAEVLAEVVDAHQRETSRAALTRHAAGQGHATLIAPDLTGAVVRIQQGIGITRDGVPAPDGLGPTCDGVLKTDDGQVLDWDFDRQSLDGVDGYRCFLQPVADQWREVLIRAVLHAAAATNAPLPVLWLYPRNLPALGHISHDTDGNDPARARQLLDTLATAEVQSTWCTILPGYDAAILDAVTAAGHELAMHYDAVSTGTVWCEEQFDEQWQGLTALFGERVHTLGQGRILTNKNHYLRWEGDTEFFRWCAARGIEVDESKGPSKTGEAGFNFGTCHPYFPVNRQGDVLNVLELATHTQDMIVFCPLEWLPPMVDACARHHGILHLLFHPAHIDKPGIADALVSGVRQGRERGMEWWTASAINAWERARRKVAWRGFTTTADGASVRLRAQDPLHEATLLWLGDTGAARINGLECDTETVERWGFRFQACVANIEAEAKVEWSR